MAILTINHMAESIPTLVPPPSCLDMNMALPAINHTTELLLKPKVFLITTIIKHAI